MKKKSIQMELKLHKKKDNDTRRQYLHFIDYRFYSFFWSEFYFPHKLFISYTDSFISLGPPAMVYDWLDFWAWRVIESRNNLANCPFHWHGASTVAAILFLVVNNYNKDLSFISHTNSLFPIQILILGWVHLL